MNLPGIVSRRTFDKCYHRLLAKEEELEKLSMELKAANLKADQTEREKEKLVQEIKTLNASLDATAAALEKTRNALSVSEQTRKRLLKEKRKA